MTPIVRHFMTESPHTIGHDQPLERAHELMRAHCIRHLPVLKGGKLVGLVSDRDLHLVETMTTVDRSTTRVDEAMTQDVYCAQATDSLFDVADEMAQHKYGSAVIVDDTVVVGVFTTTDALRTLAELRTVNAAAFRRTART